MKKKPYLFPLMFHPSAFALAGRPQRPAGFVIGLVTGCLLLLAGTVRGQVPVPPPRTVDDTERYPPPPDPARVFRLESEAKLRERMAREAPLGLNPLRVKYTDIFFPKYAPVPPAAYVVRAWPPLTETTEPPFVCYNRLYFEQLNAERYGWDLGLVHPLVSAGIFYVDVLTLPYHLGTEPCRRYEANAGYCLPGDPVPLLLYPPDLNWSGILTEAAVVGLAVVVFP
jgi:hypothetical protein